MLSILRHLLKETNWANPNDQICVEIEIEVEIELRLD